VPSQTVLKDFLKDNGVREKDVETAPAVLLANAKFARLVEENKNALWVLLDGDPPALDGADDDEGAGEDGADDEDESEDEVPTVDLGEPERPEEQAPTKPKAIFVGHGKRKGPRDKLLKILDTFGIAYKVAEAEPNLGRPIPDKVREVMKQCGSAILIFTRDEKFADKDGNDVWRPSENVVYELGAASFAYGDRIVIFKEEGINFPTNFESVGRIAFEEDSIDAKAMDLLKELVGFGLVKVTPT
jgi:hypothetical protein